MASRTRAQLAGAAAAVVLAAALAASLVSGPAPAHPAPGSGDLTGLLLTDRQATTPARAAPNTGGRPDIVMIMVDDMRADEIKYMPWTRSLIGGRGVTFDNSLAPHPQCCPARASVLTGLYTHNHRVLSNNPPWGFTSFWDQSTLATWLRGAGYHTAYIGKYLNGYGQMPPPGASSGSSLHYVPPGWDDWRGSIDGGLPASHPLAGNTYNYLDTTLSRGDQGLVSYAGRYQTKVYGNLTRSIVRNRAADERPYFLWVSYAAPHNGKPVEADDPGRVWRDDQQLSTFNTPARPKSVRGMFDDRIRRAPGARWSDPDFTDKPAYLSVLPAMNRRERRALRQVARQRAESLHLVDKQVKSTVDTLAEMGTLDDTVLVFVSDNGYYLGEQRIRTGKRFPHEPSLRVPFLLRGPGLPAGAHRQDPITAIDIAPTLAQLAGVAPGHVVDGVSLADVARAGDRGWRRPILATNGPMYHTSRQTDEAGGPLDDGEQPDLRYTLGIRTRQYLYVDVATGERELYDVLADPQQYRNLAGTAEHAAVEAQLANILAQMRSCRAADCSTPLPGNLQ